MIDLYIWGVVSGFLAGLIAAKINFPYLITKKRYRRMVERIDDLHAINNLISKKDPLEVEDLIKIKKLSEFVSNDEWNVNNWFWRNFR